MELVATRRALAPTNRRAMEREYPFDSQRGSHSAASLSFDLHLLVGLLLIAGIALGAVLLRLGEELFGNLREGADQTGEAVLAHHELAQLAVRLLGVEQEGILALLGEIGIVAEEGPVAALDGELLLLDALAHALDHAVVDAGGVSDDDGGAFVLGSFLEALDEVRGVGTEGDVGDVNARTCEINFPVI